MAYDEELAARLRVALQHQDGVEEKRMFGGLAFLVHGHMAVAASGQGGLMVRCDPAPPFGSPVRRCSRRRRRLGRS